MPTEEEGKKRPLKHGTKELPPMRCYLVQTHPIMFYIHLVVGTWSTVLIRDP